MLQKTTSKVPLEGTLQSEVRRPVGRGIRSIPKSFKVLAALTICLSLLYPLLEAVEYPLVETLDASPVTDGDFELAALTVLFVFGIFVTLIRLVLLVIRLLLLRHSMKTTAERLWFPEPRPMVLFVDPPYLSPLRI